MKGLLFFVLVFLCGLYKCTKYTEKRIEFDLRMVIIMKEFLSHLKAFLF